MIATAVNTSVPGWIIAEQAGMVIMIRSCADATLLVLVAGFGYVSVSITIKALCESAIFMIKFTLLELALKEQVFINQHVGLHRHGHIHHQVGDCFIMLNGLHRSACMQYF